MAEPMLSVYNIYVWYGAIHAIKDIPLTSTRARSWR